MWGGGGGGGGGVIVSICMRKKIFLEEIGG